MYIINNLSTVHRRKDQFHISLIYCVEHLESSYPVQFSPGHHSARCNTAFALHFHFHLHCSYNANCSDSLKFNASCHALKIISITTWKLFLGTTKLSTVKSKIPYLGILCRIISRCVDISFHSSCNGVGVIPCLLLRFRIHVSGVHPLCFFVKMSLISFHGVRIWLKRNLVK